MQKLLSFLVLPKEMSAFERTYLRRVNRIGLGFFALHLPILTLVAALNHTGPLLALALSAGMLAGPVLGQLAFANPRAISMVHGFTAMLMGALLVHFGQGPVQIEMHFYFFAVLAMLAVYANPAVILVAAGTVAVQHLTVWLWLPSSIFNYDAPLWVVGVHAAFVVVESVGSCFIARSFFDNVIGLERIVQARTSALDSRNQDMRLVLDNVHEGFLTVDRDLVVSQERSAIVDTWLAPIAPGATLPDLLQPHAPRVAASLRFNWGEVLEDIMPLDVLLEQLPSRFQIGEREYRLAYKPILIGERLEKALVIISDITAEVARERMELEQRDVMQVLSRIADDKSGVLEFFQEAQSQVTSIHQQVPDDLPAQKRVIHTLKGNALIFGIRSIGDLCGKLENRIDELGVLPSQEERDTLNAHWNKLCTNLDAVLGERRRGGVELNDAEYEHILLAVLRHEPHASIAEMIRDWRLEPTIKRLLRIGEQARALALRTGKGPIAIDIQDNHLRLDAGRYAPFWSAFVHVVRNAVDHGVEPEDERSEKGKGRATITLATRRDAQGRLVIEVGDDGRGVNWGRVAEKAREKGLRHETRKDLEEALFADGLSTADEVTEVSGRGVGMAAVRAAAMALGGSIQVGDRPGGGTIMTFTFAAEASSERSRQTA